MSSEDQRFEKLNVEMFRLLMEKNPHHATFFGLHDPYDTLLPSGSSKSLFDTLDLAGEWVGKMKTTVNFEKLSSDHQIDWRVIELFYEKTRFSVLEHRAWETNPDAFYEIGEVILVMLAREYASIEKRVEAIASKLEKLPDYLAEFRTRFKESKPVRLWTDAAIESCQQVPGLFMFIVSATEGMVSEDLHRRLTKVVIGLEEPIQEHLRWLKDLSAKAKTDWWLGAEKFDKLLEIRGLGMTSDEIYGLGVRSLAELREERERIAAQIAPGKSVAEVMKLIEADAPKTFEEALEATKQTIERSRQFVVENNIATVYPEDVLHVEETPQFMAPILPFAALSPPGKFDKRQEGVYVVTRPIDSANLGKHLNYANIQVTAVHEGFPGHFLMGSSANRGSFVHLLADGIETIEGWAYYCEEMMTERGFIRDLKSQFMRVTDGIWRAGRIILDVKLATGGMKFEEAVELLMKEAGLSREGAVAEVRRYTMMPGYALSYLLGKHLILKLRDDVKKKMGGQYDEKFFHDTIAANGYLPFFLLKDVFDMKLAELGIT